MAGNPLKAVNKWDATSWITPEIIGSGKNGAWWIKNTLFKKHWRNRNSFRTK